MHIPITRRIRRIVDESLDHCQRDYEFEPHHPTLFVFFVCILFIFLSIYLFIDVIMSNFQSVWVAEFCFNDSKQCIPY